MIKRPGTIVALLTGLNLLNYLDRLVLSAVLPKVEAELDLSNFLGGFLATVFLLGYFVTSPIFGALGDRVARKGLITLGVVVWSVATIGSGLVHGKLALVAVRAVVGVGEASYATLAPTIIDDVTPNEKKGTALAVFYAATPIGGALGYLVGGFVEHHWGWRAAFFVAGGPGLVLALACLLIEEPARKPRVDKPNVRRDIAKLVRIKDYRSGVLGYCAYTAAIGAFSYWAPTFLFERYGLALEKANFQFGIVTVIAGALATWLGGRWADRARRDVPKGASPEVADKTTVLGCLRICAIGSFAGVPLTIACFLSPGEGMFFVLVFFCIVALFLSTSPINAVILRAVPPELRASAMALSIFGIHLLGDLWSPPFIGFLSDHLSIKYATEHPGTTALPLIGFVSSPHAIQIAMLTLPFMIAASAVLWWPGRRAGRAA